MELVKQLFNHQFFCHFRIREEEIFLYATDQPIQMIFGNSLLIFGMISLEIVLQAHAARIHLQKTITHCATLSQNLAQNLDNIAAKLRTEADKLSLYLTQRFAQNKNESSRKVDDFPEFIAKRLATSMRVDSSFVIAVCKPTSFKRWLPRRPIQYCHLSDFIARE